MNNLYDTQSSASYTSVESTLFDWQRPAYRAPTAAVASIEPLSRRHDPLGSYLAADRIHRSGIAGKQRFAVLEAVRRHPGSTSRELAQSMDCDRYQPSRRLPELERAGWVRRGERRQCHVGGIVSETWFAV